MTRGRLQSYWLALRRKIALRGAGEFHPYPEPPPGVELSPSLAHARALGAAPLRLSWTRAGIADPLRWQEDARAKLCALTGFPETRLAPAARHRSDHDLTGGFRRRRVYLRLWNGADAPVDAIWRNGPGARRAAMICLQGTNSGAHLSWGEARMPPDPGKIAQGSDYALQAAARGYVAVCLEQSCFGERAERNITPRSVSATIDTANHAFLIGRTLLGERAADVASLVDWLAGPAGRDLNLDIDRTRLYAMGNSAGGSVALFAAALDPRLAGVLASGCVGFVRDTIARRRDDSAQNVVPGFLNWFEMDDVIRLVAPRPLLAISGVRDHIFPAQGAAAVVAAGRDLYRALGAEHALAAVSAEGPHRFYPDAAWPAFERLVGEASS